MKQVLFVAALLCATLCSFAQTKDTALKNYVGKYTFPAGSIVASAEIILENGQLKVLSSEGDSPLEKRGVDTFALVNFEGGLLYFQRNAVGKVSRVKVEVDDVQMEGTKEGETAWVHPIRYFDERKKILAR